jgi:hypothetical protein
MDGLCICCNYEAIFLQSFHYFQHTFSSVVLDAVDRCFKIHCLDFGAHHKNFVSIRYLQNCIHVVHPLQGRTGGNQRLPDLCWRSSIQMALQASLCSSVSIVRTRHAHTLYSVSCTMLTTADFSFPVCITQLKCSDLAVLLNQCISTAVVICCQCHCRLAASKLVSDPCFTSPLLKCLTQCLTECTSMVHSPYAVQLPANFCGTIPP